MKRTALFLTFCLVWTLSAKELFILSFDASKNTLQNRLPLLQRQLSSSGQNGNLTIKRFGDRYAIVLPIDSQAQKERVMLALQSEYSHIFSIEMQENEQKSKAVTPSVVQSMQWNFWEWTAIIILGIVLVVLFSRGVRDMIRVRRSQRLMQDQQLKMEKELKKEI